MNTAPIVNPNPDPALIDALAGDAWTRHAAQIAARCHACKGAGVHRIGRNRGTERTCPMCRGTGKAQR